MKRRFGVPVAVLTIMGLAGPLLADGLTPYQMMRSLQIVQDRIAEGDHAALPIQRKLLGVIDERLRTAPPEEFEDERNFDALLTYGVSGGNPATLELVVSRLTLDGSKDLLSEGVVRYVHGDFSGAREAFAAIAPEQIHGELAAPLGLVVGSLLVQEDPQEALRLFDRVRLLSPGTLLEEAALRRSITVSAAIHDTQRFTRASLQYVHRFLRSPYATQFAESFVSGVIALHDSIGLDVIEEVAAGMSEEQAHVIYLRLARQSAIEGYDRLLAFASKKARTYAGGEDERDPRAILYANAASVATDNVKDVLRALEEIDERRLSASDRGLLKAARRVAEEVVAPPKGMDFPKAASNLAEETASDEAENPMVDASQDLIVSTLEKLEAIDALLAEERR